MTGQKSIFQQALSFVCASCRDAGVQRVALTILLGLSLPIRAAHADALPPSADAGRIDRGREFQMREVKEAPPPRAMQVMPTLKAPAGAKLKMIHLSDVRITGMSVYTSADVRKLYAEFLNRDVRLDTVWVIANRLNQVYQRDGYFLSRVVVPQQEIKQGIVTIRVIEGFLGEVKYDSPVAKNFVVKKWIKTLLSYRPVTADQIESALLYLNDLPGLDLRAVLEPMNTVEKTEGAVRLVLEEKKTPIVTGSVSYDNFASHFMGPSEAQVQADFVFWPTHKTSLFLLTSFPWKKVKYVNIKHEMAVFEGGSAELFGSFTKSKPGYTLEEWDIKSTSAKFGFALNTNFIRQRRENLNTRIAFEAQNTNTTILGARMSKDSIRALRANANYQIADDWMGNNTIDGTVSQGLPFFGSSEKNDADLSREGAIPNFTKFTLSAARLQSITDDWSVYIATEGQVANGPLYSSEQFGYGGQTFGRAYDNSEVTGDQGMSGSIEFRYSGFGPWYGVQPVPYQFYDIGAVWNEGAGQAPYAAGSSTGGGIRIFSDYGFSGNFGLAFPLAKRAANPLFGNGKNPRYYMQCSYAF